MDVSSASTIDTRLVYGFKGAGKTTYISDCLRNDYFYKYGTTLILCFERGDEEYDPELLLEKNANVSYYDGSREIGKFCRDQIERYKPDRIYAEMCTEYPDAREHFPENMNVTSAVTWIDWDTLDLYYAYFRQDISDMVRQSIQVTFRGCPSKELLIPYSQGFRLMNNWASYLREDPLGFHEKAFDLFVPYPLDADRITVSVREYLIFWLDAAEHPEHYDGKLLCFTDPLELRRITDNGKWSAGRVVMTCCMADLQFMSFELAEADDLDGGWITMEAAGYLSADEYGRKVLKLKPENVTYAAAPPEGLILEAARTA